MKKKIIEIDDNTMCILKVSNNGTIDTIKVDNLADYTNESDLYPLYPADGTHYWYISGAGDIYERVFEAILRDCKGHFDIDNAFLTKEEAEFELERRKVIARLKLYAENNKTAIWDGKVNHYYIYYSIYNDSVKIDSNNVSYKRGSFYFTSEKLAQKAIDDIGEENIRKYYFKIIDD